MELTRYVHRLGREFATLAEAGGEEARTLLERLSDSLGSSIRMTLLEALSAAAEEITRELAPGSVELRLRGRELKFVVSSPAAEPLERCAEGAAAGEAAPEDALPIAEDGTAARLNVRLPEQLKAAIEAAAAKEGRSANAWLVRAAAAALARSDRDQPAVPGGSGKRSKQGFTGWVR